MDLPTDAIVVTIRFIVHKLGSPIGWDAFCNHWSIYLILANEEGSVRFDMSRPRNANVWSFTATHHPTTLPDSHLTHFDYPTCPGLQVRHCLDLIHKNARQNYRMTLPSSSGDGNRFWIWMVFIDLAQEGYLGASEAESDTFSERIRSNFHRHARTGNIVTREDEMDSGEFFVEDEVADATQL